MSNVPPHDPGGRQPEPLPIPQPGWIPGDQLPGAPPPPAPHGQPAYGQPAYGQPAYGQPAYGQPAYGQPPLGQPGFGQPPAPPPKSKRPAWVTPAAIAAVVVLVGGGIYVATKSDDSSSGGLSTSGAASALTEALADIDVGETGILPLSDCAGIDMDAIAKVAPKAFPADTIAAGTTSADVARLGDRSRDPLILECTVVDETIGAFSAFVGHAPSGDFETFLDRVTVNVTRGDAVPFDGGTIHPFTFTDAGGFTHNQSVWANDAVIVSLDAIGPDADSDLSVEWLQAALPGMVTEAAALRARDIDG